MAAKLVIRRNKYRAKPVVVNGERFASQREYKRWCELLLLSKAGKIEFLQRQFRIALRADGGKVVGHYVADATYLDVESGEPVIEDAKGFQTPLYKWKRRHVEAQTGVKIREV